MAIQFHPLPPSVFAAGQQWYIQRLNSELREMFALEGTLRNPRRARRSDLTVTRRGEVQVHVSRVSDQAVDSSITDAGTLDGLDSTQFLRSDINDAGTGKYTLSNATPFDLAGNLVTTIDWGLDSGTLNELHFKNTNPSQTTAQYRFLNENGASDNYLQFAVQAGQVAFVSSSGDDLIFTGVGSDITFSAGVDLTLDAVTGAVDIDAATSMAIDTAAGALAITAAGGDLDLTAAAGFDGSFTAAEGLAFVATAAAATMTAGTDITLTATGDASILAQGGDATIDAAAGDVILNPASAGVISIPRSGTLDYGTTAAMVFTSSSAVGVATYAFVNTHASLGAVLTLTLGGVAGNKLSLNTPSLGGPSLFEIACADQGISINSAATFPTKINDAGVDSDTVIEGDTDTDLIHVVASTDRVGISEAAPDSTLEVGGTFHVTGASQLDAGQVVDLETVTGTSATLGDDDYVILVDDDTAGSTVTITLPAAASHTGRVYHIKKLGTTASVVIDGNASETIDGGTTATLTAQYESIKIVCDGSNWSII